MKKIALFSLLLFVGLFVVVGCGSKKSATLSVSVDGITHISSVKDGSTLTYELLGEEYTFTISEISETDLKITVDQYGLTSGNSLISKEKEFVLEKGVKLTLTTQTTDTQDSITFSF